MSPLSAASIHKLRQGPNLLWSWLWTDSRNAASHRIPGSVGLMFRVCLLRLSLTCTTPGRKYGCLLSVILNEPRGVSSGQQSGFGRKSGNGGRSSGFSSGFFLGSGLVLGSVSSSGLVSVSGSGYFFVSLKK